MYARKPKFALHFDHEEDVDLTAWPKRACERVSKPAPRIALDFSTVTVKPGTALAKVKLPN